MGRIKKFIKFKYKGQYGSHKGSIRTYWHRILYMLGVYDKYTNVNWDEIDRLVFVCKGNICRSAYAEVVAKSLGIEAISCGISTKNDLPANSDAIQAASEREVDLSRHKTTPVMYVILRKTDLIVAMEPWQADSLTKNLKRKHYVTLLGLWCSPLRPHVQDPYGFTATYFDNCFNYIENSVNEIAKKIKYN